jgi:uncharacterized protein YndB with AHSA1/START domain/DNA-binding transcriptional ArsR family regulator
VSTDKGGRDEDPDTPTDLVFTALADRTRRFLLDTLHEENGRTLGELCGRLAMTRQAVSQHLAVLEAARLVTTVRRGREKLHYLNPVPLHTIQERWIDKFERPRLRALSTLKQQAEDAMTPRPTFVYVTYIESTPDKVWRALTDADLTAAYWGHSNVSDWREGSPWEHRRSDGSGIADVRGTVLTSQPPTLLVATWASPDAPEGRTPSRVTFEIEPYQSIVRLTVTHEDLVDDAEFRGVSAGWPAVLSNLKSLVETGSPLPQDPWLVPGGPLRGAARTS